MTAKQSTPAAVTGCERTRLLMLLRSSREAVRVFHGLPVSDCGRRGGDPLSKRLERSCRVKLLGLDDIGEPRRTSGRARNETPSEARRPLVINQGDSEAVTGLPGLDLKPVRDCRRSRQSRTAKYS